MSAGKVRVVYELVREISVMGEPRIVKVMTHNDWVQAVAILEDFGGVDRNRRPM